jgi:hypothetical protein
MLMGSEAKLTSRVKVSDQILDPSPSILGSCPRTGEIILGEPEGSRPIISNRYEIGYCSDLEVCQPLSVSRRWQVGSDRLQTAFLSRLQKSVSKCYSMRTPMITKRLFAGLMPGRTVYSDRRSAACEASIDASWKDFTNSGEMTMPKEHIGTGTKVPPGVYQCNACANEIECREEDGKLPLCSACESSSWRTRRLTERPAKK